MRTHNTNLIHGPILGAGKWTHFGKRLLKHCSLLFFWNRFGIISHRLGNQLLKNANGKLTSNKNMQ